MQTISILLLLISAALFCGFAVHSPEAPLTTNAAHNHRMDYIEFPAADIAATKKFYGDVFGWKFEDYGPGYTSFADGRLAGGFNRERTPIKDGVLVVIYASDLEGTQKKITAAGGKIVIPTFGFPGGRRFHFTDPNGNELAVWSE